MSASEKEIKRRLNAIRGKMREKGLKGLIVFSQVQIGFSGAVRYISNYRLTTRKNYLILPIEGDPTLIVPTLGQQFHAKNQSWIKDIRSGGEGEGVVREVAQVLKVLDLKNEVVGIAGLDTMPFNDYQLLTQELPHAVFKDATNLLNEIRMVKSKEEIEMIQETTYIADQCYRRLLEVIRPGENELKVMSEVVKVLVEHQVENTLILTAKGASFPGFIAHPSSYVFQKGDHYIFSVEISGPSGYWTQIVRPLCLGKSTPQYERMFNVGKAALETGKENLIPGKRIGELVKAVIEKVEAEGFKTGLWCGHGMGLDVGEYPGLFQDSQIELKEGMVITIHPHVMSLDGKEGIFLGDTFVIKKEGAKNLSHTICDLQCV